MLKIKDEEIILEKTNLEFENKAVFNQTCIQVDDITHIFYRAINHNDISSKGLAPGTSSGKERMTVVGE